MPNITSRYPFQNALQATLQRLCCVISEKMTFTPPSPAKCGKSTHCKDFFPFYFSYFMPFRVQVIAT